MIELHLMRPLGTSTALVGHGSHRVKVASVAGDGQLVRQRKGAPALKRAEVRGQWGMG